MLKKLTQHLPKMLMWQLPKKSASGYQDKIKFRLPEGKGKKRRQILKIYRQFKYVILVSLILLILIILVSVEKIFSPFSITTINPTNFSLTDLDKSVIIGKKLYLINQNIINNLLLPNHIDIKQFIIQKRYPTSLDVTAEKRTGVFKIKNDKTYLIIDDQGVVFASEKTSKLPDLPVNINNISIGTILDKEELNLYTKIVKNLFTIKLTIDTLHLEGEYVYVKLKDSYTIRFDMEKYTEEIEMFKKAITQIDKVDTIKEVNFVDNKVLIQYAR